MSYLLGFGVHDATLTAILNAYPKIRRSVDSNFREGGSEMDCAVQLLTVAIANQIETYFAFDRRERMFRYVAHNEGEPEHPFDEATKALIANAGVQKDLGKITEKTMEYCVSEVVGAMHGKSAANRMTERLSKHF